MVSWDASPERDMLHDRRRRLIIETAARVFAERGYQKTSIDDIAAELDVSKPTIYYYLKNKENILSEIVNLAVVEMDDAMGGDTGTGLERVERFLRAYPASLLGDLGKCTALVSDRQLGPEARLRVRKAKRRLQQRLATAVEHGVKDGTIVTDDPELLVLTIFGAYNWIPRWYKEGGRLSLEQVHRGIMTTLLGGISPSMKLKAKALTRA